MIKRSKEHHQSSYGFLLEPPLKPLLLDGFMSNINGFPYTCIKENDYISPILLWIEEACNNICQPWHAFNVLLYDHCPTLDFG